MRPEDGYIAYIVNPRSGPSSAKPIGRQFQQYLLDRGFDVRVHITTSLEHARQLAANAAASYDCTLAVAVGGDGTIREVAHGLEGSDKPLLIVPHGTENLLASELGLDQRLATLIRTFEVEHLKPLDLGSSNGRCFTSIAGFGFDGRVVRRVHNQRTGNISYLDYFWPIWRTFWDYKFDPINVQVDGREVFQGRCVVFVGNISRYAVGLRILQYADYGDGLLDVCIYKCASRLGLVRHLVTTLLKRHTKSRDVIYHQGKDIYISSDSAAIETQIDGDPGPPLPARITVIPHAVNIVVPEAAKPTPIKARVKGAVKTEKSGAKRGQRPPARNKR